VETYTSQQVVGGLVGLGLVYKGIADYLLRKNSTQKPLKCSFGKEWTALEFEKIHMKLDALLRECRKD